MANKIKIQTLPNRNKSVFILTFAVELLDIDLWQDCNEGWVELGNCVQGLKVQYQIYPEKKYDLNIFIWPHVAKIVCGTRYNWVRTWQFLERRWFAFTIKHAFPVQVNDLRSFHSLISITPGFGSDVKNEKILDVLFPPLKFGDTRYFAPVREEEPSLNDFIEDLILNPVLRHIPEAVLEGPFDTPNIVSDIRHQDAVIFEVRETILNKNLKQLEMMNNLHEKSKQTLTKGKADVKTKIEVKTKLEIKLSGEYLLTGLGRVKLLTSEESGPPEIGDVLVFASSGNLPAVDDFPVFFVNVEKLFNAPLEELIKYRITYIYTQWRYGDEIHESQPIQIFEDQKGIDFNDHYPILLSKSSGSKFLTTFMENPFEIELKGLRDVKNNNNPKLFSQTENLNNLPITNDEAETNIRIALCKIDLKSLLKGRNGFVTGEYPIYPIKSNIESNSRDFLCTNDINAVRRKLVTEIIPSHVIMDAQMTLEVSIGLCGCGIKLGPEFARVYCIMSNNNKALLFLHMVVEINNKHEEKITGWAVDTGEELFVFVEGLKDDIEDVLNYVDNSENITTLFKYTEMYYSRLYSELLHPQVHFLILKMMLPIGFLLSNPASYVRPTLPMPAKSALLKLGRLLDSKLETAPCDEEMPSVSELRSFWIELCTLLNPILTSKDKLTVEI